MSDTGAPSPVDINSPALRTLAGADPARALTILKRALELQPDNLGAWLNYAGLLRASGDSEAALDALNHALGVEPRSFHALLMKGSIFDRQGNMPKAGRTYALALLFAPPIEQLDPPTQTALARAQAVYETYLSDFNREVWSAVDAKSGREGARDRQRVNRFLDIISGKKPSYPQKPTDYYFPGLPPIEFFDDEMFPWMDAFEGYFPDILAELQAELDRGAKTFAPYVQLPMDAPVDQWKLLNHSDTWSSLAMKSNGRVVEENAPRFPKTLEALALLPQPVVPNRSPVAIFSALKPRTKIPPHHGVSNTRMVVHLPLIVPNHCGFRVGSETREWKPGKAWVFDDTIEHEAWNDSDQLRVILIADIWNPYLTDYEREMYAAILGAVDAFHNEAVAYSEAI
ncbi:aspartyl/asparaginyl beta-hydroxylase domain-containing protein [Phenylobacterium aquaticum]|uniref:aspartyl/asparaginyl beta-hydroxylase domain-containing protein n=1 Tax=Phenylobacterium aquaticum TaxID=1763816 RepID=UPI001F5DDDEC|nr:aspartyl/asparaginyl beta-hydroxylase domain-containing protein [Phenylobacterium aquaticum]MCI3134623.1 aspartyl/asparaginyl beta-hydroxylase domain-containing protein [Phenylobacterium aquaticum]